jgi:O-antigen ligase
LRFWNRCQATGLALLPLIYVVVLASFFLSPSGKITNNLFYLALLGFLLSAALPMLAVLVRLTLGRVLLGYLAYQWLTVIWSVGATATLGWQQGLRSLYVLGFVLLGLWVMRTDQDERRLFQLLTGAALLGAGLALASAAESGLFQGRLAGIGLLNHPGLAATLYGSLWLWWLAQPPAARDWTRTGVLWLLGGCIILTQSRGVLLALLVSVLLWGLLRRKFAASALLVGLGLGYAALVLGGWVEAPSLLQRHGWDSYRLEIWAQAWRDIQAAPLFGHGSVTQLGYPVTSGRLEPHPHSLYLTAWVRGGVIELGLLLALFAGALRVAWHQWRRTGAASLVLQLGFVALCGLTDGAGLVHHPQPFWLYFWLPVTLALGESWRTQRR